MRRVAGFSAVAAALTAVAVLLAGCAEPPRPQPSATALPGGITASIVQLRSDVAERQAQVRIHNTDDEPLVVGTVRVDDPRFLGHAVRTIRRQTEIQPGATVDIRVQLPPMNCAAEDTSTGAPTPAPTGTAGTATPEPTAEPQATAGPQATAEPDATPDAGGSADPSAVPELTPVPSRTGGPPDPASTRATVGYRFGASIAIAVSELSEPIPFLSAMYERECLGEQLSDAATVTLGAFTPSAPGEPADLELNIDATSRGEASIIGIHQTNLLSFGPVGGPYPAVYPIGVAVAEDSAPQTVHLPLVPARCDAHVVAEDKRGTVFGLDVDAEGTAGTMQLVATPEQRGEILSWVSSWCGLTP
ncbi:hypothetical protein CVS47_03076 [Microbacterium lemovicicum]|uniref:Uncharacterized protein n=1 Tax=Microbacterium lemovicicum TaxID=1072463 RepID=A0A3Q9J4T4_9MICO|nr:hypothetical protein [Microbacterium lemovicicum]AZS38419.1 hypothetical protein CVS47_03076 [Microbacterium lemovicicum]